MVSLRICQIFVTFVAMIAGLTVKGVNMLAEPHRSGCYVYCTGKVQ